MTRDWDVQLLLCLRLLGVNLVSSPLPYSERCGSGDCLCFASGCLELDCRVVGY